MAHERKGVVTFRGNPVTLSGPEIKVGQSAPDFSAIDTSLGTAKLADARGKVLILSSVPSLDTPVCDTETRRFNDEAGKLGDVEVWTISMDLPFAQKRWCAGAGITHVKTLSDFREREFGQKYGVLVKDGPLAGVDARAVFVVAKDGKVAHAEYVKEITTERTTRPRWRRRRRPRAVRSRVDGARAPSPADRTGQEGSLKQCQLLCDTWSGIHLEYGETHHWMSWHTATKWLDGPVCFLARHRPRGGAPRLEHAAFEHQQNRLGGPNGIRTRV